ncbi:M20 aminoacylase family protein [Variovorax sp. J22P271]|uniref:M20 aminoacylase family protein n=1 Tax=Variovorax davisae TaxID=3053515 RepID=UPI002577FF46|nr:M20 aminoacylase family protein [Variovorax sp. J22P271]MDM0032471.1 M20 aminoacylase family protein [Variovorax sp. J22P271]
MKGGFIPQGIVEREDEFCRIRRDIHSHPELGFEEFRTSDLIASKLTEWGYDVHRGIGGTGVIGSLKLGRSARTMGLRADMDALPIHETSDIAYSSASPGKMHACGHDGHTTMLLAAAQELAQTRKFDGTIHLIFQPAEEGLAGARKMLEDGLFEKFPCDAIFAMHNMPGYPAGKLGFREGPFMASSDTVVIDVTGIGGHGATPAKAVDPILAASNIVIALQSIVSRNIEAMDAAVVTVGSFHAGEAPNVIPESAQLKLTVRALRPATRAFLRERIAEVAEAQAASYGATAKVTYHWRYPVLVNHPRETKIARDLALEWLGEDGVIENADMQMNGEDFAFMLEKCPGSYLFIGNNDEAHECMVHSPSFDFNDKCLSIGAAYWVRLTEHFLAQGDQA